jgi:hypothetical protein
MPKRRFKKQDLLDVIDENSDNLTFILDDLYDTNRWSELHKLIFRDNETRKFYQTMYSCGLTEYQDERPFEYEKDEIECAEVEPQTIEVIEYVPVAD